MEFKEILRKRRSVRKFSNQPIPEQVITAILEAALTAPSSRNTHSTKLLVVEDREVLARMATMRDYGSALLTGAPLAIVVLGDSSVDLWRENASISATVLQLACVDAGLASCWVHINDRPRLKEAPGGEQAIDLLRTLLPIPDGHQALCTIAIGYSDFTPAALPPFNGQESVIRMK